MKLFKKVIYYLSLIFFMTGCATRRDNMRISQGVFETKPKIILTQTEGLEKASFYKAGEQGLLDLAINTMMTNSLEEKVCEVAGESIVNEKYYNAFQKALENRSILVVKDEKLLQNVELKKYSIDEPQFAPYDLSFLNKCLADYVLVLEPFFFGVQRTYYGFIPTSAPQGYTHLRIYLVKIKDNKIYGYYDSPVLLPVQGVWDNPPHFSEVKEAAKISLITAFNQAYAYFFQGA